MADPAKLSVELVKGIHGLAKVVLRGTRLSSVEVKCLRCHHESERYENIMGLTLEIHGWVESLEDALTQFNAPEDLDGENMYRCGRCAAYVKARKQLSLHEVPNILTIVLKRFQVQPVSLSEVMSEGAYMLFYLRSFPRPPRTYIEKTSLHASPKNHRTSRHGQHKQTGPGFTLEISGNGGNYPREGIILPREERYADSISMDFSDATSSDWSLFTSSDESSFTTESTRDSFSTVDHGDTAGLDPISSIFAPPYYAPEYPQSNTISCTKFSPCRVQTGFFSERLDFVLDSSLLTHPPGNVHKGRNSKQGNVSSVHQTSR